MEVARGRLILTNIKTNPNNKFNIILIIRV